MRLGQGRLVRIDHRLRTQRDGYVEITAYLDAEKIGRSYTDNGKRMAFEHQLFADHRSPPTELALPKRITQHRARRAPRLIVGRGEDAPQHRPHGQCIEETSAHQQPMRVLGFAARRQVEALHAPGG